MTLNEFMEYCVKKEYSFSIDYFNDDDNFVVTVWSRKPKPDLKIKLELIPTIHLQKIVDKLECEYKDKS